VNDLGVRAARQRAWDGKRGAPHPVEDEWLETLALPPEELERMAREVALRARRSPATTSRGDRHAIGAFRRLAALSARVRAAQPARRAPRPRAPRSPRRRGGSLRGQRTASRGDPDPPPPLAFERPYYSLRAAAAATPVPVSTLSAALTSGALPAQHIGRGCLRARWCISRSDLQRFLASWWPRRNRAAWRARRRRGAA
jgi:hypothetical protein